MTIQSLKLFINKSKKEAERLKDTFCVPFDNTTLPDMHRLTSRT